MSTQPGHESPPAGQPVDARTAAERRTDDTIAMLFREAGLALSNGHAPEILGADARARAAEEESIRAVFQSAALLQDGDGPDFRQMAAKARRLAQVNPDAATPADEELVGELTRSTLKQLPDLEVRCWSVSQTASLPLETAGPAQSTLPTAAAASATMEDPAPAVAPGAAVVGLTAHDAANIRENNWADFKRRYRRERRRQVLQLLVAGAMGAAACFAVVWLTGLVHQTSSSAPAAARNNQRSQPSLPPGPLPMAAWRDDTGREDARTVSLVDAPNDTLQVDPESFFGPAEGNWLLQNGPRFGVETVSDKDPFSMPSFVTPKVEPNPGRRLGQPITLPAQSLDNIPPELYPEATLGLRVIRMSPHSDFAQGALNVNDWITRVYQPDGKELDLANGSADNLRQWREFLATLHRGDSFDVEYQRGRLIRRASITLSSDNPGER